MAKLTFAVSYKKTKFAPMIYEKRVGVINPAYEIGYGVCPRFKGFRFRASHGKGSGNFTVRGKDFRQKLGWHRNRISRGGISEASEQLSILDQSDPRFIRTQLIRRPSIFGAYRDIVTCIELYKKMVEAMFSLIHLCASVTEYENHLFALLAKHSSRIGAYFKHEAYSNEKEWRFLAMHSPDVGPPGGKSQSPPLFIGQVQRIRLAKRSSRSTQANCYRAGQ